jgi:hypothetical protein
VCKLYHMLIKITSISASLLIPNFVPHFVSLPSGLPMRPPALATASALVFHVGGLPNRGSQKEAYGIDRRS